MEYEGIVRALLDRAGARLGDEIEVRTGDGQAFRGLLMEHHAFSAPGILTLKLRSGYNVGVAVDDRAQATVVARGPDRAARPRPLSRGDGRPRVSILATGGTIASYVDYRTGAVHPVTSPEELAAAAPELFEIADLRARIVFRMFSEDLQPEHWRALAREVAREFADGARGVVITHGTDTMSYTAAALAFFFQGGLPGSVVVVGAQRSSDRPSSDASINLTAAVTTAATTDVGEVVVVMHGSTSDESCAIHRGTRVRKMHSSRRDAFQSINARPLGSVRVDLEGGGMVAGLTEPYRKARPGPAVVDDALDEEVAIIQSYPGLWPDHLEKVVLRGLVLSGTGLGHLARRNLEMIEWICKGKHPRTGAPRIRYDGREAGVSYVVMTSQCLHGRVNMKVYSTGRDLLAAGVIPGEDMLPEVAYIKLMWVLGHTRDEAEVRRLMATDLVGELDERTPIDTFPSETPPPEASGATAAPPAPQAPPGR